MAGSAVSQFENKFYEHANFVGRNAVGAARCFSAIHPFFPWDRQHPATLRFAGFAPLEIMVRHTTISGVLALCRIWDKPTKSRKIDFVVRSLREPSLANILKAKYESKREFHNLFLDPSSKEAGENKVAWAKFEDAVKEVECDFDAIKNSSSLHSLIDIRNKCFAHSEAVELEIKIETILAVLKRTLDIVERTNRVIGLEGVTNEIFESYVEQSRSLWAESCQLGYG